MEVNPEQIRQDWERLQELADIEARATKDPFVVANMLSDAYSALEAHERPVVDQLIAEWALSEDDARRYDALVLVDQQQIASALLALRSLSKRLAATTGPEAFYEREAVQRVISKLTS